LRPNNFGSGRIRNTEKKRRFLKVYLLITVRYFENERCTPGTGSVFRIRIMMMKLRKYRTGKDPNPKPCGHYLVELPSPGVSLAAQSAGLKRIQGCLFVGADLFLRAGRRSGAPSFHQTEVEGAVDLGRTVEMVPAVAVTLGGNAALILP